MVKVTYLYNHDLWMTLIYFMARSPEVAYPRSHVNVYRTIGPLVIQVTYMYIPNNTLKNFAYVLKTDPLILRTFLILSVRDPLHYG